MAAGSTVHDLFAWGRLVDATKPWLLLGKGPSFERVRDADTSGYHLCALNHVVRELPVTLAHAIDIDVVVDCAEAIDRNARWLVMPWHPHVHCSPTERTLEHLVRDLPVLRKLDGEGRLVWYNLAPAAGRPGWPVIPAATFSAEAALNVLATAGARVVRSLGVDGGASYGATFSALNEVTLLRNGRASFDRQFEGIARTLRRTDVLYAPLHVEAPVRVFVGTDANQRLAAKVLELSIRKRASMSVTVTPIDDTSIPAPGDPSKRSRTGFSFSRFAIPALCGRQGRAIYVDADMLVLADIARLWTAPMGGAALLHAGVPEGSGRRPQFSVLLLDCAALPWDVADVVRDLDAGAFTYDDLMSRLCIVPPERRSASLAPEWNSLESFDPRRTCLLHYTDMPTQPWVSPDNPNGQLWYDHLREAILEGSIPRQALYEEVAAGHVSPDLPRWAGFPDPPGVRALRRTWRPPFASLPGASGGRRGLRGAVARLRRLAARVGRAVRRVVP